MKFSNIYARRLSSVLNRRATYKNRIQCPFMTPIRLTLDQSPMCNTTTCTQTHVHVHVWCFVLL